MRLLHRLALPGWIILFIGLFGAACNNTPAATPPGGMGITVTGRSFPQGTGSVVIQGTRFTPGGDIAISYTNVPARQGPIQGAGPVVHPDSNGDFVYEETVQCTTFTPSARQNNVLVVVRDLTTGSIASGTISGDAWVCTP